MDRERPRGDVASHCDNHSDEYLLRKLLRCERCGARMHGTRGSKAAVRRYMCSTRRYGHSCGERIVKAESLEGQLIDWIRAFQPDGQLHDLLQQATEAATAERHEPPAERRSETVDQLKRLQDLCVLGDLTKAQYIMRRQALEEELQRQGPPAKPAIDRAKALLEEFPPLLGAGDRARRAAQAPTLTVRASLGAERADRRRATTRRLPALLPSHPERGGTRWCRRRERRGSGPVFTHRGIEVR